MKENKSVVLLNAVVSNCRLCFASKSEKRNTMGFTRNCHPEFISGSTPLVIIQNKEEMLKQVQHDNRRGFTLIELLVVVLIIGILAAVAVPQYQKAVTKSRVASLQTLLDGVVKASNQYYLYHGTYPKTFDDLDFDIGLPTVATSQNICSRNLIPTGVKQGDGFQIVIYGGNETNANWNIISAHFTTGKYKCRGLVHYQENNTYPQSNQHTFCGEHWGDRACGTPGCEDGLLCKKVMGKTYRGLLQLMSTFE